MRPKLKELIPLYEDTLNANIHDIASAKKAETLRCINANGKTLKGPTKTANKLDEFFVNKIKDIQSNFMPSKIEALEILKNLVTWPSQHSN